MRNYVQYSENLNGFPTFFIFLSLMLIFGSMALRKLECMRGVERRKLKTKLNWRALEAAPSLCMQYFSNLVNCICPELSSVFLAVSIFWEEEPNWIGEGATYLWIKTLFQWRTTSSCSESLDHAVFVKIGQLYFSGTIEIISHRLGSILVKRKVKPKLNWTTWGVLPSLRMKSLFKWPTANQLLLCGNVKSNSNFRSLWLKLNFAERVI